VHVGIDEAGRDDLAGRVDDLRRAAQIGAELHDLAAENAYVGLARRRARSIDDGAVLDDQVIAHC
jgi:hypothetical protein